MFERHRRGRSRLTHRCTRLAAVILFNYCADGFSYFPQTQLARTLLATTTISAANLIESAHDLIGLFDTGSPDDCVVLTTNNSTIDSPQSKNQLTSIRSESPAVLLTSGPGTGKTHTLASRVAYLLREKLCPPQKMVIMSFSNRDADALKSKAIDQVFNPSCEAKTTFNLTKEQLSERLWGGTIHKFAGNILRVYSSNKRALRVLSNHEAKMRIDRCVRQLLDATRYKEHGARGFQKLQRARLVHRDALVELRQSRDVMLHQIGRCIELWKESAMLPPPSVNGISIVTNSSQNSSQQCRDGCLELATRLGITPNVAFLAWSIFPLYQDLHEHHRTGDPADLVPLAYHLLLSNPGQLSKLRSKLNHIILDEYQDISVAQHALIRLVVRGVVDELDIIAEEKLGIPPVLAMKQKHASAYGVPIIEVPHLFCAGDSEQSIYGFRGAAPELSVGGFRTDFPQGIIAHLEKSFRLARNMWSTVNALITDDGRTTFTNTFMTSPVGASRARATLYEALNQCTSERDVDSLVDMLSEDLVDDMTGTIHVQGVWDCREEAKHVAMMIRRRANERTRQMTDSWKISFPGESASHIADPSEVAIIVRAANQLDLIREALEKAAIPYVDVNGLGKTAGGSMVQMKPVVLMTMHGSKGEEFDDVYLPGWSEGVFPHPSAVSGNRVEEERRLAYVAISRARHRVFITHAFVRRAMHAGKNLGLKMVTMQVRPSRFLYELVPNGAYSTMDEIDNLNSAQHAESEKQFPTITWDRSRGSKGGMAGTNLPEYFRKSYEAPKGFTPPEHPDQELLIMNRQLELVENLPTNRLRRNKQTPKQKTKLPTPQTTPIVLRPTKLIGDEFEQVLDGVNDILSGKYGSCTKHKTTFMQILQNNFGMSRGKITLFPFATEDTRALKDLDRERVKELFSEMPRDGFLTRPLSQSTALQLGLFLLFSFQGSQPSSAS